MQKTVKIIIKICIIVVVILTTMGITDYHKTMNNFEKPIFAKVINGADDGGSGDYVGLGYTIIIQGNLDIEYGYVIHSAQFNLFGNKIRFIEIE